MTVSVMASGQIGSDGTGSISGTHSPGGQPHAIVVVIIHNGTNANEVSTLTYGGITMRAGQAGTDTVTELLRCQCYYLDYADGIPTGDQTVSLTVSGSTSKRVYCVSLSSDAGGLSQYSINADNNDQANPTDSLAVAASRYASGVACLASGNTDANTSVANGAELQHANFSGNLQSASLIWANTTVNNATITMGWTVASDDVAASYIYFNELKVLSGNVKLSGVNQSGAKVDVYYRNAAGNDLQNLVGQITTDGSGNYSTYIHKGVIPFVMFSYDAGGGTVYTAPLQWNMVTT